MENRVSIAVQFLKEGRFFKVDGLLLSMSLDNCVEITGWTLCSMLENVSVDSSLSELEQIKEQFYKMVNSNPDLNEFISGKSLKFQLSYDDGGKTSIDICSELDNVIQWQLDLSE